ncbi:MAG: hypothetical protein Q9193_000416 [Seirophora villosa]
MKAIENRTVRYLSNIHQIQSGQVIVDLCSVVKELVENSLDAGATSVDVRFKGNGLESIEVQDNGSGISGENYTTIALKHYTSKLSTYDDLSSLRTFGFRGEALSSLCALSTFHIVTAQADEAPKGTRLDFETSGRLKTTSVVASQKGTTVTVENLFTNLPVRRRGLEKNIKREYAKVLGLLQAYACVSTAVKFSVSNLMAKGKRVIVFATKSNTTTRENVANVFGAKTLPALIQMDLSFSMLNSRSTIAQADEGWVKPHSIWNRGARKLTGSGINKPVFGEGRQTPDRQMFFINSRPCSLPQFAKVFNEVYKSYNVSQSPFVFANIILDTNAYDVNVSPDKRTILLHDQARLLESLRGSLIDLFEKQDQTVPETQRPPSKLPVFRQLTVQRQHSVAADVEPVHGSPIELDVYPVPNHEHEDCNPLEDQDHLHRQTPSLIGKFAGRDAQSRPSTKEGTGKHESSLSNGKPKFNRTCERTASHPSDEYNYVAAPAGSNTVDEGPASPPNLVTDLHERIAEQQNTVPISDASSPVVSDSSEVTHSEVDVPRVERTSGQSALGVVQNAFDRMRPRRQCPQVATITIGKRTTTAVIGATPRRVSTRSPSPSRSSKPRFKRGISQDGLSGTMQPFTASEIGGFGTQSRGFVAATVGEVHETASLSDCSATAAQASEHSTEDEISQGTDIFEKGRCNVVINGENECPSTQDSDDEYWDEEERKAKEDAKVANLIQQAEDRAAGPTQDNVLRAGKILQRKGQKDSTTPLLQTLRTSVDNIESQLQRFERILHGLLGPSQHTRRPSFSEEVDAERKLSLTVGKEDFARMKIVGQFNLGFILTVRPSTSSTTDDEVFIIDQHASDEKYNFERLQASTTVQNQRLVRPKVLDLTAIEEENVAEHNAALLENGFVVSIDQSGESPVGQRCRLISLPMSREVTFDLSDLEELITLLGDSPTSTSTPATASESTTSRHVPRPSKIRKLFAMRACRSSVMIGKTLQLRQMEKLVRNMGEIDKPWNCPHGRPTMRHVIGLRTWRGWEEGDGLVGMGEEAEEIDWTGWLEGRGGRENDGTRRHANEGCTDTEGEEAEESRSDQEGELEVQGAEESTVEVVKDDLLDDEEGDEEGDEEDEIEVEEETETRVRQSISQRFLFS